MRGTITKKANGKFLPRFRGPDGRTVSKQFDRKQDAQRWLDEQTSALTRGTFVDPASGRLLFGAFAEDWLVGKVVKPKTAASYRSLLDTRILPTWERVPLNKITHTAAQAWVAGMVREGLSASRTRQAAHLFGAILSTAVRDGRLGRNPADRLNLPKLPRLDKRFLTHAEVAALADAAGDDGLSILVLSYCGLRWGELAALRVRRVDLLRGRVEVAESVAEVGGDLIFGSTKTHARRTVVLPKFLRPMLAEQIAGRGPGDLVFTAPEGGTLRLCNWRRRVFDPAARVAGLRDLSPHDLRHTAASLAISSGATVLAVQSMLGHSSAAVTLDIYSGLFPDELDAVADRLDAARAINYETARSAYQVRTSEGGATVRQLGQDPQ